MIRISVVVPFYNAERYIAACIEGLLSQSYPLQHHEIVMVDNNSTDASTEIVKRYPHIKLLSEKKQGAYVARNRGVREATGNVVAFTDADCVPSSDWLQEIETAVACSDVGVVVGSRQFVRGSFFLPMLEDYEHEKNNYIFRSSIKELYYGYTNNMAVRKSLFDEVGPFVERARGSDVIFVRRCVDKYSCEVVCYAPQIQVRHMEIDSPSKYFHKAFIYANSIQKYRHIVPARSLSNWERLLVFRRTVQSQQYSGLRAALFFGLLIIGLVYWILGSISTTWNFSCYAERK